LTRDSLFSRLPEADRSLIGRKEMWLPTSAQLGLILFASELLLSITKRSRGTASSQDANSLRLLWIVIGLSIFLGFQAAHRWPGALLPQRHFLAIVALILFIGGLFLRWFSIIQLGRFFTVNVAIAEDHQLIDSGPYRFIRHPSYTGALLAFLGFALSLGNWAAILVMVVPIFFAFVYRMQVEEAALRSALGERYLAYTRRTKRLVPFIY
jgi:protein-S-isoprenylcysteine O-methyltransferase